jgi:hypothetical protein
MRGKLLVSFAILVCCLVAAWVGCAGDQPVTPKQSAIPVEGDGGASLYEWAIGPIDGITTAWHQTPREIVVPEGTTIPFKCGVSVSADVAWSLAPAVRSTRSGSIASYHFGEPGRYTITALVDPNREGDGTKKRRPAESTPVTHSCLVMVVPATIAQPVVIESMQPLVGSQQVRESASNYETMRVFFNGYISPLRKVGPNAYRTSLGTPIILETTLADSRFASLVETRVTGQRPVLGVSEIRIAAPGHHTVSVGPPAAPKTFTLETFAVNITSHHKGQEFVNDGIPTTFVAKTDPPGFEKEITWLACTKLGHATPVMGSGPTFTATFSNTSVSDPGSIDSPWLGVRADNASFSQDVSSCVPWSFPYDGLDHRFAATASKFVFTASAANVDSVTVLAQNASFVDLPGSAISLQPGATIMIRYSGAAYYVIRPQDKPQPKPTAEGTLSTDEIVPAPGCGAPNPDILCSKQVTFYAGSWTTTTTESFRISARNASSPSDCAVEMWYTVAGTEKGRIHVGAGVSSGFTIPNPTGAIIIVYYRCSPPGGTCRVTYTMQRTGPTDIPLTFEEWKDLDCGAAASLVHKGFASGNYKVTVAASNTQASQCAVVISCKIDGVATGTPVTVQPGTSGFMAVPNPVTTPQKAIEFFVSCNGSAPNKCRVAVTGISAP